MLCLTSNKMKSESFLFFSGHELRVNPSCSDILIWNPAGLSHCGPQKCHAVGHRALTGAVPKKSGFHPPRNQDVQVFWVSKLGIQGIEPQEGDLTTAFMDKSATPLRKSATEDYIWAGRSTSRYQTPGACRLRPISPEDEGHFLTRRPREKKPGKKTGSLGNILVGRFLKCGIHKTMNFNPKMDKKN